jgi:signal transduction histidine kinase
MSPDKRKELEEAYQIILATGLNQVPLDGIEELITPDVMGFGTTVDEKIHDLLGFINMVKSQEDQSKEAGLDFSFQPERIHQRISPNKDSALFVEQVIVFLKSEGEIVHQFNLRFSVLMEYLEGHWKMVHWHTSVPVDTENDTWHIDKFRKEKEKLEKLVADQTTDLQQKNRELEIEAATQRVRAVAMGMQKPDDIMNVLNVLKEEVDKFDLGNIATWIWTKDEHGIITQWDISEVIEEGNFINFNLKFDIHKWPEVNRHLHEWKKGRKYYEISWKGGRLQSIVNEVGEVDAESGKLFQEAVDAGQIEEYWHAAAPYSKGVVGLDFTAKPPEVTESILLKMSAAFDMAYQRFEDLQKAEAQTREAQINLAVERVRARALAMFESTEILEVVKKLRDEIMGLDIPNVSASTIHLREPDGRCRAWDLTSIDDDGNGIDISLDICYRLEDTHPDFFMREVWARSEDYFVVIQGLDRTTHTIDWLQKNGYPEYANDFAAYLEESGLEKAYHPTVPLQNGRMSVDLLDEPTAEIEIILKKMASAFDLAYKRFEDLKKAEAQAYESKVEASLERVRGMAAAMNHSDDLMQIAEAMFKEMEILKINPLRFGLGLIDGEKKEAELWASTVDDGHYLDMLGTLSLTWHPMLQEVFNAWNAQHEEVIYELKGKELSDYYQKIGEVNPDIPNLEALQNPQTGITQFVSFFPFKSGALYAFTSGEPGEDGKAILKRFANVFEQAHIRFNDLQIAEKQERQIREERDRLADTLKELRATQEQLIQQEKLASLGQLTAGIAHEIKNPLNFVNNFSELSVELVEEIRHEIRDMSIEKKESPFEGGCERSELGDDAISAKEETTSLLLDILDDIETNLKTIHKHGSRADSIVKSMLQHSRGGSGEMEPADLNAIIKEYVNLAFHGMRAGKEPINVDIDLQLDETVGEVPLVAEDFSRVILNLVNNAFDAMREKTLQGFETLGGLEDYQPKLTVRTHQNEKSVTIEVEDNGCGIPDEMKDKIMQPFFTTKKGTAGTGLGLSITNDIIKAHGGVLKVKSTGAGTAFSIILNT